MKQLTKAEEDIMQVLWQLEKANVKAIIDVLPTPKPAYNTVSTIVRILENKKFIKHKKKGKGYIYLPKITKDEYRDYLAKWLLEQYFDCSNQAIVDHFNRSKQLDELL